MTKDTPLPSGFVTFMFTDIVDSTQMKRRMPGELSSEREAAFVQRIKDPHGAIVAERVKARGGFIIKSTGDGFLIAFADAEKAVLCGVEIQESLNAAAIFTPDGPLQIRIGLNSGHAESADGDYTSSAVDKAARVESKAGHGQVYLSRETYAAVREKVRNISINSVGNHDMKGVGEEELFVAVRAGQAAFPQVTSTLYQAKSDPIPKPPAFYAEPAYIGSHEFVGRERELITLDDWASAADPYSILLFEAIGGAGKSMITWEWVNKWATTVREDWAGRFWYSFYERGADMSDFCRRAMAYVTRRPLSDFHGQKTSRLAKLLVAKLQSRPWLVILDGLERVLVAYHRFDAAQVADEQVDTSKDQIARRNLCDAIRPEDDELLRTLAAAAPSKLLITTRLTPRALLNPSSQGIQGVLRVPLPGLRPADAEQLLRACGVTGASQEIQNYLNSHCDCHPLVTGILAGLINDYLPDRGNFDAWAADPNHGGQLNLATLDLVQKRNHILHAALDALPEKARQLLSTLALVSEAVDFPTLSNLNPHLPPEPEKVSEPERSEEGWRWGMMTDDEKEQRQKDHQAALELWKEYQEALRVRLKSAESMVAQQELVKTVRDLERRGLLQYDRQTKRYDLHPVVRGVATGGLRPEEKEQYGQRVVDHFSRQAHSPYEEAETLDDLRDGIQIVRTLLQMGRHQEAYNAYMGDLNSALGWNLEAYAEMLSLLRPFFPQGWVTLPNDLEESASSALTDSAGRALFLGGEQNEALAAFALVLLARVRRKNWPEVCGSFNRISIALAAQNRLGKDEQFRLLALDLSALIDEKEELVDSQICRFVQLAEIGQWTDAERIWQLLPPRDGSWPGGSYDRGYAESVYAQFRLWRGDLTEDQLTRAEQLVEAPKGRRTRRYLHELRGEWHLEQGQWALAVESLHEAVRMAREVGQTQAGAEAQLALAKFHLGQLSEPRQEAEQLATAKQSSDRNLADLWLAIGDLEQAKNHALAAYEWAWSDGEPYVHRYELNKARAILERLGAEIPNLPSYDPAKDEKFPWEDEVATAIEKLRAEKEAEQLEQEDKHKEEKEPKKEKQSVPKKIRRKNVKRKA